MYAAGDCKTPHRDSVLHMHNHMDRIVKSIFSP